ncbi:MAG TPA: hypothetical protein ENN21_01250 [Spirochaetes bacterium]|nr:hypothetical protein [Spirochaetota bacterium]
MRYYCPGCHADFSEDHERCPRCGINIASFFESRDYIDKLIAALRHPEPSTPLRAAWLLGKIGDPRAEKPLMECALETDDLYFLRAALLALGDIATEKAIAFVAGYRDHDSVIVRDAAERVAGGRGS